MLPRVNIEIVDGIIASMQKQHEAGDYLQVVHDHMLDNNPALLLYIYKAKTVVEEMGMDPVVVEGILLGMYDQLRVQDEINELEG